MEDNKTTKTCNGRCEECNINQRTYCAAQIAYYNQQEIAEIKAMLTSNKEAKIDTIISKSEYSRQSKVPIPDSSTEN